MLRPSRSSRAGVVAPESRGVTLGRLIGFAGIPVLLVLSPIAPADPPIGPCGIAVKSAGYGNCTACDGETGGVDNCTTLKVVRDMWCAGACPVGQECVAVNTDNIWRVREYDCLSGCNDPESPGCATGGLFNEEFADLPHASEDCACQAPV